MNFKKTVLMALAGLAAAAPVFGGTLTTLDNEKARVSYAIGLMLGNNFFKRQGLTTNEVDVDIFAQGVQAVQTGSTPLLSPEQAQAILKQFQQDFSMKRQQQLAEVAAKSKADGEAFLAANKSKPGVQSLADGLQYLVITNGTGPQPGAGDTVTVDYRGTLIDGTEFDSSYKRGQPAQFPVGGVIHGWTEALQMMPVGSKWKLFIPSELAYGERGGPGIPPNSVLIFEVELLATKGPVPAAPVATPPPPLTSDIIKVPSADELKKGAKIEVIKPEDAAKLQDSAQ